MRKLLILANIVLAILIAVASSITVLAFDKLLTTAGSSALTSAANGIYRASPFDLTGIRDHSLTLAPIGWGSVVGVWIWRGRIRTKFRERGFDKDVFRLLTKMRGGVTRLSILRILATPKDRMQLASELRLDWKTVDRHIEILDKYGLVREQSSYGRIKLFELTPIGKMLLQLMEELDSLGNS